MKHLAAWVLLLSLLAGCEGRVLLPYAREMGDTALLRTVGLDVWGDGVLFTVSTGGRSGGEEALVLSASGSSIPAAALAVQSLGDGYVYYGHVDQLLIGEGQATQGLAELMDYLAREPQLGPGVQLWAVRGSAGQAIQTAGKQGVPARLEQMQTDGELGAANLSRTAAQLMSVLAREGSTYLPALEMLSPREGDGGEGGEQTLLPNGYAVLRRGRLVCWTDSEVSRGLELMEGQVLGQVTDLTLEDGTRVSFALERARTDARPVFRGRELIGLDVTCDLTARVAQTGRRLKEEELEWLRQSLERLQGERIVRAVELGQHWDADYLDLERRAQLVRPDRKTDIQEQWRQVFRSLDIRVEVNAPLERSGGMMEG